MFSTIFSALFFYFASVNLRIARWFNPKAFARCVERLGNTLNDQAQSDSAVSNQSTEENEQTDYEFTRALLIRMSTEDRIQFITMAEQNAEVDIADIRESLGLVKKVHEDLRAASDLQLSAEDQQRFAKSIVEPPAPNDALQKAVVKRNELLND